MNHQTKAATAERAALEAVGVEAMEGNLKAIAELSGLADQHQRAEHIRGIVATTMEFLSSEATAATRAHADQWRAWALSLTGGMDSAVAPTA